MLNYSVAELRFITFVAEIKDKHQNSKIPNDLK